MIPIMSGKAMTMVMIPIMDKYDVYEVRDEVKDEKFLIAHARSENKLLPEQITIAGIIKELKADKKGDQPAQKFLEIAYILG